MNKEKLIAVLFTLILLSGVGVIFLKKPAPFFKKEVQPQELTEPSFEEPITPEDVTKAFYDWYINCVEQSFESPEAPTCLYKESEYVTSELVEKIEAKYATFTGGGADLIVCAQDIPTSFVVGETINQENMVQVMVTEYFGEFPNKLSVYLKLVDGKWRIFDIVCAIPGGLTYENEKYGFRLTLPEEWEGYKATFHEYENISDICFSFEDRMPICVLQIYIHTKDQWASLKKKPAHIAENDEFVFSYDYSPDCVQHDDFQCARSREVPAIIDTFKFITE
ncbi:MAG: hypothetical protein ABIJ82_00935 [Patescibacteria group bacterium]